MSTGFVTTTHGCTLSYEPYKAMMGQTINKVTYYTDAGIYELPMDQKVPVKFDGEVSAADASIDVKIFRVLLQLRIFQRISGGI